jgi:hypothetical protein
VRVATGAANQVRRKPYLASGTRGRLPPLCLPAPRGRGERACILSPTHHHEMDASNAATRAEGPQTSQPRATPWGNATAIESQALKGRHNWPRASMPPPGGPLLYSAPFHGASPPKAGYRPALRGLVHGRPDPPLDSLPTPTLQEPVSTGFSTRRNHQWICFRTNRSASADQRLPPASAGGAHPTPQYLTISQFVSRLQPVLPRNPTSHPAPFLLRPR